MRKIRTIAKLEISILFFSPIAWLLLTIFIIQCGISFLGHLQDLRTMLSMGGSRYYLTADLFGTRGGLFANVQENLYLYMPILTMGLMSREISSGSIKLLLAAPVKLGEIILGKYLAIIIYGLLLILVLGLYAIIGIFTIKAADVGMLLSGLFGVYLLICTYAAIGLFMSSLTSYQVVAAVSTLAVFAILRFIGTIWQSIDFVRDLTYFVSISGRTDNAIDGILTTKDIFYFLIIISVFLALCLLRLKSEREQKNRVTRTGRYVLLTLIVLLSGYITSRPSLTGYLDTTAGKSLTITKNGQKIAAQILGPLKITTYVNLLDPDFWIGAPEHRNLDIERLEEYKRFIPGMDLNYVYYYQQPVDTNLRQYRYNPNYKHISNVNQIAGRMTRENGLDINFFLTPAKIDRIIDLKPEGYIIVRDLEYKGKHSFLRFFNDVDPYASEAEVMAALKRFILKAPKVLFITGNNEGKINNNADRDYSILTAMKGNRAALVNQGFDVDTLNLQQKPLPANADIVVIANPTITFSDIERERLISYLNSGGNMLIMGEPGREQILNPVLKMLNIELSHGIIVSPDQKLTPGFMNLKLTREASIIDNNMTMLIKKNETIAMQNSAAIEYADSGSFKITPLILSAKNGWIKKNATDLTAGNFVFDPGNGDKKGVFPVNISMKRNVNHREQRIIVSGNAGFVSNEEISRASRGGNVAYMEGLFRWLSNGTFPINVTRPQPDDIGLKVSDKQITGLMWLFYGIIPGGIAIAGAIILFRRRIK